MPGAKLFVFFRRLGRNLRHDLVSGLDWANRFAVAKAHGWLGYQAK